jgi:hypothetical protein
VSGDKSKAPWGPPPPPPTGGGHLGASTGHGGQSYQAAGNITRSTVNINRNAGWTAFAVLVAAAAGAVGAYVMVADQSEKGPGQASSLSSGGTSTAGPPSDDDAAEVPGADTTTGAEARSRPPQDQSAEPAEQWRGTLLLDLEGKELDTDRPSKVTSSLIRGDLSLGLLGDTWQVYAASGGSVALWEQQGKEPGQADCAASADTTGSASVNLRRGAVLCLRTDEGRTARLKVTKFPEGYLFAVEFDAVVWELSSSPPG